MPPKEHAATVSERPVRMTNYFSEGSDRSRCALGAAGGPALRPLNTRMGFERERTSWISNAGSNNGGTGAGIESTMRRRRQRIVSGQPHHLDERLFARFSLTAARDAAAVRRYGCSDVLVAG